jgi:phosphopantothenoylcysteine decarboxylase/phosphopantothenate--cysteine ligase
MQISKVPPYAESLKGKKILLGISGSIAAFKACDIIRLLKKCGAEVKVVLTDSAQKFVTPVTLETLSGNAVLSSLWGNSSDLAQGTHHIDTARWADLALVAPATANVIAKLANGLADDLLTTELLAFQGPILIAPAMNPVMYNHPATQANVAKLVSYGHRILGPTQGETSCGEEGLGRMIEPEQIVERVASAFYAPLNGKKMIINLGPTRSAIDPVRYMTNRSSGLMGAALCWEAVRRGYQVTAICGPVSNEVELPSSCEVRRVVTAKEMADETLTRWPKADFLIASAAVLDWDVRNPAKQKLKKEEGAPRVQFDRNVDIVAAAGLSKKKTQYILAFSAETHNAIQFAVEKLASKGCDAIFANDVSIQGGGFESDRNGGWWISAKDTFEIPMTSKAELAGSLLALVEGKLPQGVRPAGPTERGAPRGIGLA